MLPAKYGIGPSDSSCGKLFQFRFIIGIGIIRVMQTVISSRSYNQHYFRCVTDD